MKRRQFLKMSSTAAAALTMTSMSSMLARAAEVHSSDDYKALVCVFLYGGLDNHDTVIPYDQASYSRWAEIRQPVLSAYSNKRTRSNLLSLTTPSRFGARQFALPPEMPGLQSLYQSGKVAIVGNVGPLIEPTTAQGFANNSVKLPSRLFSHNDQQSTWMSGSTEGAQFGWAGKIQDSLLGSQVGNRSPFSAVTMSSGDLLITGQQTSPYHLIGGDASIIELLEEYEGELGTALSQHFSAANSRFVNFLRKDIATKHGQSYDANELFRQAVGANNLDEEEDIEDESEGNALERQLQSVARVIKAKDQLQVNRQVFVVTMGGFDTHSNQATDLPALQQAIDRALSSFYQEMETAGMSDKVTLFTASEFGRTLAINDDGTDHGWAGHHFVMGGAVNGGAIYGDIPPADFGHELDAGSGRLIPTMSLEQYAANFASWMGLTESEITELFPSLNQAGWPVRFMW